MKSLKKCFYCCIAILFVCNGSAMNHNRSSSMILQPLKKLSGNDSTVSLQPIRLSESESLSDLTQVIGKNKADVSVPFSPKEEFTFSYANEYEESSDDDEIDSTSSSSSPYNISLSRLFSTPKPPVKIILSIDGGGSRGIIPLFYVNELSRRLEKEFGNNIRLPIDMYAGTSVGALIATATAMGKQHEVHERYFSIVNQIFSYKWWKWPFTKIFLGYTYEPDGRAAAIRELVTPENEKEIESDLIIPFCSAKTHDIFKYRNYANDKRFSLFDALMSSSAAPTYFPPHVFTGLDNEHYEGTDGGIFANHPGAIALDDAFIRYPGSRYIMISIGTGQASASGNTTKGRNLISWAQKISDLFMNLQSKKTDDTLISIAGNHHTETFRYIRINPTLDRDDYITDGTSTAHLERLEMIARQSIEPGGSEKRKFEEVFNILKGRLDY
ncbi:MAG: patatin-like phospholipase family protein [Alphaproteobacteria bacterium]|nr:patatin-like phospholipase family protein [Alphaproteobacteria bacterium]